MARDIEHSESEDELMLRGDLTPAYAHTCDKVVRTMRFFPHRGAHGILEICDEVTAKSSDYQKFFLLHCHHPPIMDGNTVTLTSGHGGRLVCRVIEPRDAVITAIGGEGMEYVCDGTNYPPPEERYESAELGWGRVCISPSTPTLTDRFLVELEICDE